MRKLVAFVASVALAHCAFADAANLLFSFSTKGPDYYADGVTVAADGEWYALTWVPSADEVFAGFNPDFTPVNPAHEVVLAAPLAKNGHCPDTVFQVDSAKKHSTGKYQVFLVDTRTAEGEPSPRSEGNLNAPEHLNGAQPTTAVSMNGENVSNYGATPSEEVDWSLFGDGKPVIKAIAVDGELVKLTVGGMHPLRLYTVLSGSDLNNITKMPYRSQNGVEGRDVDFLMSKDESRFFKVIQLKEARRVTGAEPETEAK